MVIQEHQHTMDIVYRWLEVAHHALYKFRNMELLASIVLGLKSPSLARLEWWKSIPAKERQFWETIQGLCDCKPTSKKSGVPNDPFAYYAAYFDRLKTLISEVNHVFDVQSSIPDESVNIVDRKPTETYEVLVIPWLLPVLAQIRHDFDQFCSRPIVLKSRIIVHGVASSPVEIAASDLIRSLSEPGQRRWETLRDMLDRCTKRYVKYVNNLSAGQPNTMTPALKKALETIPRDYIRDISQLGTPSPVTEHWLLTRVYMPVKQLMDLSYRVKPVMSTDKWIPPPIEDEYETHEEVQPVPAKTQSPQIDANFDSLNETDFEDIYKQIF
jgi:hypothetical protein